MACDITLGRTEPCKDSVGGIKAVYFVDFGGLVNLVYLMQQEELTKSKAHIYQSHLLNL